MWPGHLKVEMMQLIKGKKFEHSYCDLYSTKKCIDINYADYFIAAIPFRSGLSSYMHAETLSLSLVQSHTSWDLLCVHVSHTEGNGLEGTVTFEPFFKSD